MAQPTEPLEEFGIKLLTTINEAWSWIGLVASSIVAINDFGGVIALSADGDYWRIDPDIPRCERIAGDEIEFERIWHDEEFQFDWQMLPLVRIAAATAGPLTADRCYCLKVPSVLGGSYAADNIATNSRLELIGFAGDLAHQIKDMPDGTQVKLVVVK
jgi:hypothetical protein